MTAAPRRGALLVVLTLALAAGCSRETPALSEATSEAMTASVVDVAEAVSAGDLETASATLDGLQRLLDEAGGGVTPDRAARIQLSIDVVRADLDTLVAAGAAEAVQPSEPQPAPEPSEAPVETQDPVAPATEEPVVTPEPAEPAEPEPAGPKGNDGVAPSEKGKDKGKAPGKGKSDG